MKDLNGVQVPRKCENAILRKAQFCLQGRQLEDVNGFLYQAGMAENEKQEGKRKFLNRVNKKTQDSNA